MEHQHESPTATIELRIFGSEQEQKSFLFKMLQSLLPTKERLHRFGKVQSPSCILCQDPADNPEHLITCQHSTEVTAPLLQFLISQDSSISPGDIITLNIQTTESMETCRAELKAKVDLLRCTKWKQYSLHNSAVLLDQIINLHFC